MKNKKLFLIGLLWLPFLLSSATAQTTDQSLIKTGVKPNYKRTNYANQSILLKNDRIQLKCSRESVVGVGVKFPLLQVS